MENISARLPEWSTHIQLLKILKRGEAHDSVGLFFCLFTGIVASISLR